MSEIKKISFEELRDTGYENKWKRAVIVFKQGGYFKQEYSELQRSYEVSSDDKAFTHGMISDAIHGRCIDGSEQGVRLDRYMWDLDNSWQVDYCYVIE